MKELRVKLVNVRSHGLYMLCADGLLILVLLILTSTIPWLFLALYTLQNAITR